MADIKNIQHKAFLYDATRCIDCRACMIACSVENNVEMGESYIWLSGAGLMGEYPDLKRVILIAQRFTGKLRARP